MSFIQTKKLSLTVEMPVKDTFYSVSLVSYKENKLFTFMSLHLQKKKNQIKKQITCFFLLLLLTSNAESQYNQENARS